MQNAKDSFYMALRTRLVALNPSRTILLRGAVRPGILVEEAEAPLSQDPPDVFILRWSNIGKDSAQPLPMEIGECEIVYQTQGTQAFGGLDRGRLLSAMDRELCSIVEPPETQMYDYSSNPPRELSTRVFWDEPMFCPTVTQREMIGRSAKIRIYSYGRRTE